MRSFTDTYTDWDLVACTPTCRRPWRRRRWRAPRIWTCPGCRTRWTVEGRRWVEAASTAQLARLEHELGLTEVAMTHKATLQPGRTSAPPPPPPPPKRTCPCCT